MIFEIKSHDNRILYSLEKSEMFPDYRSVLQEALAFDIDLNGLFVMNENIDNIQFNHFKTKDVRFENCSMVNVQFIESEGESISFSGCNLNRIKFKRSKINEVSFYGSDMNKAHFIKSEFPDLNFDECNLSDSEFLECRMDNTSFYHCQLPKAIFNRSSLKKARFVHMASSDYWMQDVRFEFCEIAECDLKDIKNVGVLYIVESDIDHAFTNNENFTKLSTFKMSVLYAINSDSVWWNYDPGSPWWSLFFRGSFNEFKEEVNKLYPDWYVQYFCYDFPGDWIYEACNYLERWKKYNDGVTD